MNRARTLAHLERCREEAARGLPLTPEELQEFSASLARQIVRDDAARAEPSPQLDLPEAA